MILPDYQGIGLGRRFLNFVSDIYVDKGFDFSITTSAKNLMQALVKDSTWALARYGHVATQEHSIFRKTTSEKRITATFFRKKIDKKP